ncbi:MAG: hypothetical protein KIPDCIKN_01283 [Haliscomenobacter sp.]|jgi:hypothetical protein|nr:hypothetical protein [Haliscomenobacter sp.]
MMKVKWIVVLFCLFSLASGLQAQRHETLFGRTTVVGGFGGPIVEWGLNNKLGTAVGGGGGVIINDFFLGFYGMGSIDFEKLLEDNQDIDQLDLGHTGLWLGFTVPSFKLLHLYGSTRIGWGAVNVDLNDPVIRYDDLDHVFVVTPEIGAEINLTRWFRVAGAVGYRYLDGVNKNLGYSNDDFRGTYASMTLRFGGFGRFRSHRHDD